MSLTNTLIFLNISLLSSFFNTKNNPKIIMFTPDFRTVDAYACENSLCKSNQVLLSMGAIVGSTVGGVLASRKCFQLSAGLGLIVGFTGSVVRLFTGASVKSSEDYEGCKREFKIQTLAASQTTSILVRLFTASVLAKNLDAGASIAALSIVGEVIGESVFNEAQRFCHRSSTSEDDDEDLLMGESEESSITSYWQKIQLIGTDHQPICGHNLYS